MNLESLSDLFYRPTRASSRWHQFDIGLVRHGNDARASAHALFGEIVPRLDLGCAEGRISGWFFMRKPPDVRLRLLLDDGDESTRREVLVALSGLLGERRILQHSRGQYRPETERFGGATGLHLAHACFGVDARLWWALEQLELQGQRRIGLLDLAGALIRHLFDLLPGSGPNQAWRALAELTGPARAHASDAAPPAPLAQLLDDPKLDPEELRLLQIHAEAQRRLADGLLASAADLGRPPAQILATVALFNLNRHGVTAEHSAPLAQAVVRAGGLSD